ncbi:HEPN domain-containing protein [Pseudohongiella spirulinae]|nr:HEPN domain-containing protein [Pseudohongiella spirulinae]
MDEHRLLLAKVQSQQFQAAFERCWNLNREFDLAPEYILGMPALMCAALSIEIGLKSLLIESGTRPKKEHNLRLLLNALPPAIKAAIVDEVKAKYPDFQSQIANAEKAFVTWRYFYESEEHIEVNILFVGALGAADQKQLNLKWEEFSK